MAAVYPSSVPGPSESSLALVSIVAAAALCVPATVLAQTPAVAELPRVFLDTRYAPPDGGSLIRVAAGGDLQRALNDARPGDVIELQAGATFTGNFVLPNKSGSGWIHVRSSAHAELPLPGTRVLPAHAPLLPKIVTANLEPAIRTAAAAHHYRFVGVEISATGAAPGTVFTVVSLESSTGQTTLAEVPTDLVFDRCWVHGTPTGSIRRGIALNSARTAVIDSSFSDFHVVGQDAQAIAGWNGPGPFQLVNNYLEGAAENVMFGGGAPSIANLVPSDIEIRGNHLSKPLSWRIGHPTYAGTPWSIKNLFELKNARRVLVEGNVLEHCWEHHQNGFAVLFTVRGEGVAAWSTVEDVTFRRNIVRHAGSGINTHATDNNGPSQPTQRILIRDNLFDDISAARWGGPGRLFQFWNYPTIAVGIRDMIVEHNTGFPDRASAVAAYNASPLHAGFVFRDNIAPKRTYGFAGATTLQSGLGTPNVTDGDATLERFFVAPLVAGNVLTGASPVDWLDHPSNFFPASDADVEFLDLAGGDYRLAPTSPFKNAATDGTDPGADILAIEAATASAISGVSTNPQEASPAGDLRVGRVGATLEVFYTPACGAASHAIYFGASPIAGAPVWTGVTCDVGVDGTAAFDPGTPPPGRFFYFVVVGQSFRSEGSYGRGSQGIERPEASGLGACDEPQSLGGDCFPDQTRASTPRSSASVEAKPASDIVTSSSASRLRSTSRTPSSPRAERP